MKKPGKARCLQEECFDWKLFEIVLPNTESTRSTANTSGLEVMCFRDTENAEFRCFCFKISALPVFSGLF